MINRCEPEYRILETGSKGKFAVYRYVSVEEYFRHYRQDERIIKDNEKYWLMVHELEGREGTEIILGAYKALIRNFHSI